MAESHFAPHSNFEVRVVQLGTAPALSQVTAQLPSSTFTAVLGTSGSGKSILLALLAGRLDMESFEFDGVVSSQHAPGAEESIVLTARDLQHISAYVPPEDIVFGFDTPREAIVFRHRLLYGSTAKEAAEAAQGLLDEFGLTLCADNLIAPGVGLRGISGGQRRRTCIAMALATRPKLLLLDEPTTGLDSYTAKSVISGLQTVARKYGLVVVAALQQPGSDLFQYMDRVVQLTERGKCLMAGPVGESRAVTTNVEPLTPTADVVPGSAMLPPDERRAITLQQFTLVVQRHFRALLRNPASLGMRVAQTIFMSLFFGFIFFRLDLHPNNFKQIMGFLICYVTAHFMPVQTGAAVFPMEKDVFLEEQALPFRYPAVIYALSKTLVETVVAIPLGVVYAIIIGCLVNLPWDVIGNLCITTVLMTAAAEALGFFVSTIAPPAVSMAVIIPVTAITMMIVGTSLASPSGDTKVIFDVLKYLAFMRCGFAVTSLDVLSKVEGNCTSLCYFPSGQAAIASLDLDSTSKGREWGLLVMWFVLFRVASAVSLTVMGWDRRVSHEARARAPAGASELAAVSIDMANAAESNRAKIMYTVATRMSVQWAIRFRVRPRSGAGSDQWRTILQPMEGVAHAGRCLAVMGGSGAGKSTLLEALTLQLPGSNWYTLTDRRCRIQAVDPYAEGDAVLGAPFGARARSLMAVVYQDPQFIDGMTVLEVVEFAAAIHGCEAGLVDALLEVMDLGHARDVRASTLSVSQKKRLSVCEALATRRPIVLLDEPTSGLDATSAKKLLSLLHTLAHDHGVTVLYTLHQPGDDLLPFIDDLLLLSQGSVVYHGPLSEAGACFSDYEKPVGLNDTDHYLELASARSTADRLSTTWREGHPSQRFTPSMLADVDFWTRDRSEGEFGDHEAEAAILRDFEGLRHPLAGFVALVKRSFDVSVLKVPRWNLGLRCFTLFIFVPLIVGISQYKQGDNMIQVQNGVFMVGLCLSFSATLIPLLNVALDLPVLLRDQTACKYSPIAYYFARTVAGLPLELLGALVSSLISYFMIGMGNNGGSFLLFFAVMFVLSHTAAGIGFFLGVAVHALIVSAALGTLTSIMFCTGAGVLVAPSQIDSSRWMHILEFISPVRQGMLAVLHDQARFIANGDAMIKQTLEFNRDYDGVTAVWLMLFGLLIVFRLIGAAGFLAFTRPATY